MFQTVAGYNYSTDLKISGFSTTLRLDRNSNAGGITLFVGEVITAKLIFSGNPPVEEFYVKINLRK